MITMNSIICIDSSAYYDLSTCGIILNPDMKNRGLSISFPCSETVKEMRCGAQELGESLLC